MEKAARDALLFQTSDVRLRKKVLAEDSSLEETVKLGLAYKQTQLKSDHMTGANGKKREQASVKRVVQEEVKMLNLGVTSGNICQ